MTSLETTSIPKLDELLTIFEKQGEMGGIGSITREGYLTILEELYRRDPATYFNKYYMFKSFPKMTTFEFNGFMKMVQHLNCHMYKEDELKKTKEKYMPELYAV